MGYPEKYLETVCEIAKKVDLDQLNKMIDIFAETRRNGGRLFILGCGGSAANCGHAVNDFRKLAGIETYAPTDNVAELTARTNDEGWETVFTGFLEVSKLNSKDTLFILSVGGGNKEKNISANLVYAMEMAQKVGAKITGIVGRDGGYTGRVADAYVNIPTIHDEMITPQAEAWQGMIWHLMVSDPRLLAKANKWESVEKGHDARV